MPVAHHGAEYEGPGVAAALDELHLRKIDLADEVLVINVGGYIGESTRREIAYAEATGEEGPLPRGGAPWLIPSPRRCPCPWRRCWR